MSKFYLATVAAVIVSTSLASNVLLVGTRGAEHPGLAVRRWLRRFRRAIDAWVAAMIARRERQATLSALHRMSDRALTDIGLCRGRIGDFDRRAEQRSLQVGIRPRR